MLEKQCGKDLKSYSKVSQSQSALGLLLLLFVENYTSENLITNLEQHVDLEIVGKTIKVLILSGRLVIVLLER